MLLSYEEIPRWEGQKGSIYDDIESFFTKIQNQEEVKEEVKWSFFMPKLSSEELKLVEQNDREYLLTYFWEKMENHADVNTEEMKKSDSNDKFVHAKCCRHTILLSLDKPFN